ncbi:hypothetical protein CFOL_v3_06699, partial [Cephalotus follicularis]
KGKKVCSSVAEPSSFCPFRLKLTTDNLRWNSLKIPSSKEFEDQILANLNEPSLKALDGWSPIEILFFDVDTQEIYKLNLAKKEAFWFEPMPDVGQKKDKSSPNNAAMIVQSSCDVEMARKEFVYSVEPFRHIVKKRDLSYNNEIALCWAGSKTINKFYLSVLHPRRLDL